MAKKTVLNEKDLAILVMIHRLKLVIPRDERERRHRLKRGGACQEHVYLRTLACMCVGFNYYLYFQVYVICPSYKLAWPWNVWQRWGCWTSSQMPCSSAQTQDITHLMWSWVAACVVHAQCGEEVELAWENVAFFVEVWPGEPLLGPKEQLEGKYWTPISTY